MEIMNIDVSGDDFEAGAFYNALPRVVTYLFFIENESIRPWKILWPAFISMKTNKKT